MAFWVHINVFGHIPRIVYAPFAAAVALAEGSKAKIRGSGGLLGPGQAAGSGQVRRERALRQELDDELVVRQQHGHGPRGVC